jgi:peptidyl-prolyl cis-trans isomerase D
MLDLIRKKQKSVFIQIVFWAIIATFVGTIFLVWGKGDTNSGGDASFAAKVNNSTIPLEAYQSAYGNIYRLYQNVYRDQLTPQVEKQLKLREQALDLLVEQELLLQEAERRNLEISNSELVAAIAKEAAFQENGAFNKERYLQVLRSQRMTTEAFETLQERQLLVEKVRETLRSGVTVSDSDIELEQRNRNEKIDLNVLRFSPADYSARVSITPAALQAYFSANAEQFRLPEQVTLDYIIFEPQQFRSEVVLSDEELDRYYRRHLDRYEIPETVRASHILIRTPQGADPAIKSAKRAAAEKILTQVKAGKDFAALARSSSEDPGSASSGGDLGRFPRGAMVAPFEEAAFALKPGEVSGVVETSFGFHIIKVTEHSEGRVRPLAEVLGDVKNGLQDEKAAQLALEKALDAFNMNRKGGSLAAAAKAAGLTVRSTGLFAHGESVGSLGANAEINANAFALARGEFGRPTSLPQGAILYAVAEKQPSRVAELREVKGDVEQAYRKDQAQKLARAAAENAASELRKRADLRQLSARIATPVISTGLFARSSGNFIPQIGVSEPLMKAAFTLDSKNSIAPEIYEIDGSFLVAALKERQAPPATVDVGQREELRKAVLSRKQGEVVEALIKDLKSKAAIEYSPALTALLEG